MLLESQRQSQRTRFPNEELDGMLMVHDAQCGGRSVWTTRFGMTECWIENGKARRQQAEQTSYDMEGAGLKERQEVQGSVVDA